MRVCDSDMANSRGPSTARNITYNARNSLLPPKCPFPSIAPSYADYMPTSAIGQQRIPKFGNVNHSYHHRASSESLVIEEQPSWLDELLNEPETPVQRGHRRSSSDSFTYLEAANAAIADYAMKNEHNMRNLNSNPSWGARDFVYKDVGNASFLVDPNVVMKNRTQEWDSPKDDNLGLRRSVSLGTTQKLIGIASNASGNQDAAELGLQDSGEARPKEANLTSERKDYFNKNFALETDTKRAKQQFAQRSRVRKLQYIAELERNVQALQAEGFEVSAQLEFLNQQSLILGMENKALKQRLENLSQEQLIKRLEHEVLEREIGRLRALYQQQKLTPPQSHRRNASQDRLDFQFANLTLKNKDSSSVLDPVSSQPRT